MAKKLIQVPGKEFIRKLLSGERDFSNIKLEERFDLSDDEQFQEIQKYLRAQNLSENPIKINGSDFKYFKAAGLYLPFIQGESANLGNAHLMNAHLMNANLMNAHLMNANLMNTNLGNAALWYADLRNTDLRNAHLMNTNLMNANLGNADLWNTDLGYANLWNANLGRVRNLEQAINLAYATFDNTRVTEKEKEIIEKALKQRKLFVVED